MSDTVPFQPQGSTVNISASNVSSNVALTGAGNGGTVRVFNAGTATIFLAFGTSSSVAATTTAGIPIPSGMREVYTLPPTITHAAAITASSTATVYFTTGQGGV